MRESFNAPACTVFPPAREPSIHDMAYSMHEVTAFDQLYEITVNPMDKMSMSNNNSVESAEHTDSDGGSRMLENAEFYAEAFVQNGIFLSGIVFNVINLYILRRISVGENYRVCLLALTVTDLLACALGVTQLTVEAVYFRSILPFGYWHSNALVVYLLYYVFLLFMCTSSAYVILIAVIRTYTLHKPMRAIRLFTPKKLKRVCVIIFCANMLLFLPTSLFGIWQNCFKEPEHPRCRTFFNNFPNAEKLKYYFFFLSMLYGPCVIVGNIVCLVVMKRALKKGQHTASERLNRRPRSIYNMVRRHSKITRTLALILVLDTIWIVPTCIQYIGLVVSPEDTLFKGEDPGFKIFDLFAEILLALRPTYTIFVFLTTNRDFRRQFCRNFCCCYDSKRSPTSSSDKQTPTPPAAAAHVAARNTLHSAPASPNSAILRVKPGQQRQLAPRDAQPTALTPPKPCKQLSWCPDVEQQQKEQANTDDDARDMMSQLSRDCTTQQQDYVSAELETMDTSVESVTDRHT